MTIAVPCNRAESYAYNSSTKATAARRPLARSAIMDFETTVSSGGTVRLTNSWKLTFISAVTFLLAIVPAAWAQNAMTAEPTVQEVRASIKAFEAKDTDALARGLALIKLASFGPKSAGAAGDVMRFLVTADINEPGAVSMIAQKVVAANANAAKLGVAELRRARKVAPERCQQIAEGVAQGSLESSALLLAEPAWAEASIRGIAKVVRSRDLTDAECAAMRPRVPLLVKALQSAKPPRGEPVPAQFEQGRDALEILAKLGPAASAGMDALKKIAADPAHPLNAEAARALGQGGLSSESVEHLLDMVGVDATQQAALDELRKRDLQSTVPALTSALADSKRCRPALTAFSSRLREHLNAVDAATAQNKPVPAPVFNVDASLAEIARSASATLTRIVPTVDVQHDPNFGEDIAVVSAAFAKDVPEMLELLVLVCVSEANTPASRMTAMRQLGSLGEVGLNELEKLAKRPEPTVADTAAAALMQFPVADPVGYAKQMLTLKTSEEVDRGMQRLTRAGDSALEGWLVLLLDLPDFGKAIKAAENLRACATQPAYKEKVVPVLVKRLSDADTLRARGAAAGLAGDVPSAAGPLIELLKRVGHAAAEPAEALTRIGPAGTTAMIDFANTVGPRDIQPYLDSVLLCIPSEGVKANLAAVEKLAMSNHPVLADAAIKMLAKARPESSVVFERLVGSASPKARATLAEQLSADDPTDTSLLQTLATDGEMRVAETAMRRLANTEKGRSIVLDLLRSHTNTQRIASLHVLAARPSDAELNALATLTIDSDITVRQQLYAQARGSSPLADRIAFLGLDDADPDCRSIALQAITQVRHVKSAADLLKLGPVRDTDVHLRDDAHMVLSRLMRGATENVVTLDVTVLSDLIKVAKSPEPARRRHAVELLGGLVNVADPAQVSQVIPTVQSLTNDPDPATSEAAKAAFARLSVPR